MTLTSVLQETKQPSAPLQQPQLNTSLAPVESLIITAMAFTDSWTHEIESPVAASRLFRAGVMDWHTLAPKLAPHIVASAHPVEGEGGIGSVRQFNFTSGTYASLTIHACHLIKSGGGITRDSLLLQPCPLPL